MLILVTFFSPSSSTKVVIQIAILIANSGTFTQVAKPPPKSLKSSICTRQQQWQEQASASLGSSSLLQTLPLTLPPFFPTQGHCILLLNQTDLTPPRFLGFETSLLPVNYEAGTEVEFSLPAGSDPVFLLETFPPVGSQVRLCTLEVVEVATLAFESKLLQKHSHTPGGIWPSLPSAWDSDKNQLEKLLRSSL